MSTWRDDLKKSDLKLAAAYAITGNQSDTSLRNMVKALKMFGGGMNTPEENERLEAAQYILRNKSKRGKNPAPMKGRSKYFATFVDHAAEIAANLQKDSALTAANVRKVMLNMALPQDNPNFINTRKYMPEVFNKTMYDNAPGNIYDSEFMQNTDAKMDTIIKSGIASMGKWPRRIVENPRARKAIGARSQITKKPPTKRLKARRAANTKRGYFPNPTEPDKMFSTMTDRELQSWVDGAHKRKEYDQYFERAITEMSYRESAHDRKKRAGYFPNPATVRYVDLSEWQSAVQEAFPDAQFKRTKFPKATVYEALIRSGDGAGFYTVATWNGKYGEIFGEVGTRSNPVPADNSKLLRFFVQFGKENNWASVAAFHSKKEAFDYANKRAVGSSFSWRVIN